MESLSKRPGASNALARPRLVAERTNQSWRLIKPLVYPADAGKVDRFLEALSQLSWQQHISAQELKDSAAASGTAQPLSPPTLYCVAPAATTRSTKQASPSRPQDELAMATAANHK